MTEATSIQTDEDTSLFPRDHQHVRVSVEGEVRRNPTRDTGYRVGPHWIDASDKTVQIELLQVPEWQPGAFASSRYGNVFLVECHMHGTAWCWVNKSHTHYNYGRDDLELVRLPVPE